MGSTRSGRFVGAQGASGYAVTEDDDDGEESVEKAGKPRYVTAFDMPDVSTNPAVSAVDDEGGVHSEEEAAEEAEEGAAAAEEEEEEEEEDAAEAEEAEDRREGGLVAEGWLGEPVVVPVL